MSEQNNELTKMIDKLVVEKTFGLDALEAIKSLRDKAADLAMKLEMREGQAKAAQEDAALLRKQLTEQSGALSKVAEREAGVVVREKEITKLEGIADKHAALATQAKEFVGLIFRNQTIMTSKMSAVAVDGGNGSCGYVNQHPESETKTVI